MSETTHIASSWTGRLVDQKGKRSWAPPELYTGLAKLTATLMCRSSEADALRPIMGSPHPIYPLMLCDERTIQENPSNAGMTAFVADYYGMRLASDEARIFQPRARVLLNEDQIMSLGVRHLHLGRTLDVKWIAILKMPRPQEMGQEFAAVAQTSQLSSDALDMYRPRPFVLKTRTVIEYGPYSVMDDVWTNFEAYEGTGFAAPGSFSVGDRGLTISNDSSLSSILPYIPFANANRANSFEIQLSRFGFIAQYLDSLPVPILTVDQLQSQPALPRVYIKSFINQQ